MKTKQLFTATLLLLIATYASPAFSQVSAGIKHGVAMTTFAAKGNLYNNDEPTFSYTAGAYLTVPVYKSIELQTELNYVRKGRTNESSELQTIVSTDYMIHYMQVPLLLQYRNANVIGKDNSSFFVTVGPYAAFALDYQTRTSSAPEHYTTLSIPEKNNTDWGAVLGIGFQTPVRGKNVRMDLRYDLGLTEIANQPDDYRTKSLSLTIGMQL